MPLYTYLCPDCGATTDEFRKIAERNDCPECELCKVSMQKLIGGHSVIGDVEPYWDDNLQTGIKSKQHRKEIMREQGVSEKYGKGWH
jgi:putative FmdB family regulatory protein